MHLRTRDPGVEQVLDGYPGGTGATFDKDASAAARAEAARGFTPAAAVAGAGAGAGAGGPGMRAQAISRYYVELFVANDKRRFTQVGTANLESDSASIVNIVAADYAGAALAVPTSVVLVAQTSFVAADPYTVSIGTSSSCTACSGVRRTLPSLVFASACIQKRACMRVVCAVRVRVRVLDHLSLSLSCVCSFTTCTCTCHASHAHAHAHRRR